MKQSILIVITLSTLLLGGCKIRIEVPEGGRVTTESGSYDCETGAVLRKSMSWTCFLMKPSAANRRPATASTAG